MYASFHIEASCEAFRKRVVIPLISRGAVSTQGELLGIVKIGWCMDGPGVYSISCHMDLVCLIAGPMDGER